MITDLGKYPPIVHKPTSPVGTEEFGPVQAGLTPSPAAGRFAGQGGPTLGLADSRGLFTDAATTREEEKIATQRKGGAGPSSMDRAFQMMSELQNRLSPVSGGYAGAMPVAPTPPQAMGFGEWLEKYYPQFAGQTVPSEVGKSLYQAYVTSQKARGENFKNQLALYKAQIDAARYLGGEQRDPAELLGLALTSQQIDAQLAAIEQRSEAAQLRTALDYSKQQNDLLKAQMGMTMENMAVFEAMQNPNVDPQDIFDRYGLRDKAKDPTTLEGVLATKLMEIFRNPEKAEQIQKEMDQVYNAVYQKRQMDVMARKLTPEEQARANLAGLANGWMMLYQMSMMEHRLTDQQKEIVHSIVDVFLETVPEDVATLRKSGQDVDLEKVLLQKGIPPAAVNDLMQRIEKSTRSAKPISQNR